MGDDEPEEASDDDKFHAEVEAVEDGFEAGVGIPLVAQLHADVGQRIAPRPGADKRVDMKANLVHFGNACGKGDESTNDGEHATDQHGDGTVACEEMIDTIEIALAEEQVAAVALDHGASTPRANPIGRDGAEIRCQRCDGCQDDEIEL